MVRRKLVVYWENLFSWFMRFVWFLAESQKTVTIASLDCLKTEGLIFVVCTNFLISWLTIHSEAMKPEDRRVSRLCDTGEMKGGAGISVRFGPYMIEVSLFVKILQTKRKKNPKLNLHPSFLNQGGSKSCFFLKKSLQEDGHESGRSDDWWRTWTKGNTIELEVQTDAGPNKNKGVPRKTQLYIAVFCLKPSIFWIWKVVTLQNPMSICNYEHEW